MWNSTDLPPSFTERLISNDTGNIRLDGCRKPSPNQGQMCPAISVSGAEIRLNCQLQQWSHSIRPLCLNTRVDPRWSECFSTSLSLHLIHSNHMTVASAWWLPTMPSYMAKTLQLPLQRALIETFAFFFLTNPHNEKTEMQWHMNVFDLKQ